MQLRLQIIVSESLYVRNPELTNLGKKIIQHGVELIYENGFDAFNFKKLASYIGTTEAGIYRYFENKQQLLKFLTAWHWSWLEYQIRLHINNITDPVLKLLKVIDLLTSKVEDDMTTNYINEAFLHQIVSRESIRSFGLSKLKNEEKFKLFKSYTDLCKCIEEIILSSKHDYLYPKSLTTTLLEMSQYYHYAQDSLPYVSDELTLKQNEATPTYLHKLVFSSLGLKIK